MIPTFYVAWNTDLTSGNTKSFETDGILFSLENRLGREGSGGPIASAMEKGQREVWDGFIPHPQVPNEVLSPSLPLGAGLVVLEWQHSHPGPSQGNALAELGPATATS